jgi:hypothetical protein
MNWSLMGTLANQKSGAVAEELSAAHAAIEPQEDEHLYHGAGWARELWHEALGIDAQLPPPEEQEDVDSAEAAAQVQKARAAGARRGRRTSTAG